MNDLTGIKIDRYLIQEKLGEGGMAIVYKALHTRLKSEVAIKLIRTEMFPPAILDQMLKRFEREATALARLKHPNIVTVHDFGEYGDAPYLVMEYLPGGTLRERMGRPIPYHDAARLLVPIADALAYAHSENIVHRDVKPVNILFAARGEPKLSDFGIARLLGMEDATNLTASGMGLGTPAYMAPEQWKGQASPAVDIYALGVVLYEMLAGQLPYAATNPAELIEQMATQPLPDPRMIIPGLPDTAVVVTQTALQRKPEQRFESMTAFAKALEDFATGATPAERTILQTPPAPVPGAKEGRQAGGVQPSADSGPTLPTPTPPPAPNPAALADSGPTIGTPISAGKDHPRNLPGGKSESDIRFADTPAQPRPFPWLPVLIAAALVVLVAFAFWPGGPLAAALFATQTPTQDPSLFERVVDAADSQTPSATFAQTTPTLMPTATNTPTATPEPTTTNTPEPTNTPTYAPGDTRVSEMDGMTLAYIPAGSFQMGGDADTALAECQKYQSGCDPSLFTVEAPTHTVTLDAFWLDTTEVTNAMYSMCVDAGQCTPPESGISLTRDSYYGNSQYADYPVIYVSWNQAVAYCEWAGRRLPTEAEWEYAARGGLDGKLYPWGDAFDGTKANFCDKNCPYEWANKDFDDGMADTAPVASYAPNVYGLYDMVGNVWEWVNDWFGTYPSSSETNPTGPSSGEERARRGGSFGVTGDFLLVAYRRGNEPAVASNHFGFRCASSP